VTRSPILNRSLGWFQNKIKKIHRMSKQTASALTTALLLAFLPLARIGAGPARRRGAVRQLNQELRMALWQYDGPRVRSLVRRGASVHTRVEPTPLSGQARPTLLMVAVVLGDPGFVREVLKRGANAPAGDEDGWTPLMLAAADGNAAIVDALLAARAKVQARTKPGDITALKLAHGAGHEDIVRQLQAAGAGDQLGTSRFIVRCLGFEGKVPVPGEEGFVHFLGKTRVTIHGPDGSASCSIGHNTCPNSLASRVGDHVVVVHLRDGMFIIQSYRAASHNCETSPAG
jgi:hypothetical protein